MDSDRTNNGRVDIVSNRVTKTVIKYSSLYEETDSGNKLFKTEAVKNVLASNQLQELFFSEQNIDIIQKLLAYHVKLQSNGKHHIGRQSDNELKIIMKSIYLQYGKNLDSSIQTQVKELNAYVLDYCIPLILSNIEQYIIFKKDVSTLPVPLDNPKYTSASGTRTAPDYIF
jgi:hypothetical protein